MLPIHLETVTKRYGDHTAVDGISLSVEPGALFGFLGPNGAGKTTTIRVILGLLRATSGRATALGRDCWRESHLLKRDVGYVPGDLRLYPWISVNRGLDIIGRIRHRDLRARGQELAEYFELDPTVLVHRMSRGMRQKVGLILSPGHDPQLLILDEPTSALDPIMQERLAAHLRERAQNGATVFFSSHTLSEVENLCDHVAIVRKGRIVADEPLESLRARAERHVTVRYGEASPDFTTVPQGLRETSRAEGEWRGVMLGPARPLIEWAAKQPVADLDISPPDLDALFLSYYRTTP